MASSKRNRDGVWSQVGAQHWAQAGFKDLFGRHEAAQFVADGHRSVTTRRIAEMEHSNWGQFTGYCREP